MANCSFGDASVKATQERLYAAAIGETLFEARLSVYGGLYSQRLSSFPFEVNNLVRRTIARCVAGEDGLRRGS